MVSFLIYFVFQVIERQNFFYNLNLKYVQSGRSLVGFPMDLLDFSIYLIVPAALWPWG
jgi:hypothetical protein